MVSLAPVAGPCSGLSVQSVVFDHWAFRVVSFRTGVRTYFSRQYVSAESRVLQDGGPEVEGPAVVCPSVEPESLTYGIMFRSGCEGARLHARLCGCAAVGRVEAHRVSGLLIRLVGRLGRRGACAARAFRRRRGVQGRGGFQRRGRGQRAASCAAGGNAGGLLSYLRCLATPPPLNTGASAWADATPRPASRPSRTIIIARMRRRRVPRCISRQPFARTGHSRFHHPGKRADEFLPTMSHPSGSGLSGHIENPTNCPTALHPSCYPKKRRTWCNPQ